MQTHEETAESPKKADVVLPVLQKGTALAERATRPFRVRERREPPTQSRHQQSQQRGRAAPVTVSSGESLSVTRSREHLPY